MRLRSGLGVALGLAGLLVDPDLAFAEAPILINPPLLPYVRDDGGRAAGPAVELAAELAKAAGLEPTVALEPMARALGDLELGNRIVVAITRTAEREAKFTWIAEVFPDSLNFFTVKPNPPIDTIESAMAAGAIGVLLGGAPQTYLAKHGVTSFDIAPSEILNAKKLDAGRMASWFGGGAVGKHAWRSAGLDPAQLQIGKPLIQLSLWIAASKDVPAEIVQKMQKRYAEMKLSGEYDRIVAPLK